MTSGDEQTEAQEGHGSRVLGLVTDPDMPTQVGTSLAGTLTQRLTDRTGHAWTVEVVSDPVTAAQADTTPILNAVEHYLGERGWGYAVCLTDLPLLLHDRAVLADGSTRRGVGVVSLPALGGLQPTRRMRQMLTQLIDDLLDTSDARAATTGNHRLSSWLTDKLGPIRRTTPPGEDLDVRYTSAAWRGWLRLLSGMVRTNRPWRLVLGLSSALAAALATSAFGLSSSTIWMLGDRLSTPRQLVAAFAAVGVLVGWLISAHGLWERAGRRSGSGKLVPLYNASTVVTLVIGVGMLYAGLFVVNLGIGAFLITPDLLASTLSHPVSWTTYVDLAWGFTTMGVVAGALGSSLESDQAVRQAAYGYREERRRTAE